MEANKAAMREALETMLDECCSLCDVPNQMSESGHACNWRNRWSGCQSKAIDKALAVILAPPRNCDRFAKWHEAWDAFVAEYGGPTDPGEPEYHFGVWLFAKEEGKEASNG